MGVKVAFQSAGNGQPAARNIAVPKIAVRQREGRDMVWVVRDDRVERRAVTLGATRGDEVTIEAGLKDGEKIVVEGPADLTDAARVTEAKR